MPDGRNPQRFADALRANAGPGGPELAVAFQEHELTLSRRLDQLQLSLNEKITSARSYGQVATAASGITLLAVAYLVQSTFTLSGQVGGMQEQIRNIDQRIVSMEQNLNTKIDSLVNSIDAIDNRTREMADRAALDAIEPESGDPDFSIPTLLSESFPIERTLTAPLSSSSIVASARAAGFVAALYAFIHDSQSLLTAWPLAYSDVVPDAMMRDRIASAEILEAMRFRDEVILRAELARTMEDHTPTSSEFLAYAPSAFDMLAFRLVEPYEWSNQLSAKVQAIIELQDSSSDLFLFVDVSDGNIISKDQSDIIDALSAQITHEESAQRFSGYVVIRRDLFVELFDEETFEMVSQGQPSIDEFIGVLISKSMDRSDRESDD